MRRVRWLVLFSLCLALLACTPGPTPTASPAPVVAPTAVASPARPANPTAVASPTATRATPQTVQITVYFTDRNRFNTGTPPFEAPVLRSVPAGANLPEATLSEFFKGPSADERTRGLEAVTSGFAGFSALKVQDGIARAYLTGPCASNGATYTIAQPILRNLLQYKEIKAVKIYDAEGTTTEPEGMSSSIPVCLEP